MKRNGYIGLLLLTAVVTLGLGCKNEAGNPNEQSIDAILRIECNRFTEREKNIGPSDSELQIASYHVTGSGPAVSTPLDITTESSPVSLGKIAIGYWNITVEAKNKNGKILTKGVKRQLFSPHTTSTTLELEALHGEGTLSMSFSWPTDQVSADASLVFTLTGQDGNAVAIVPNEITRKESGSASLEKRLIAGSYILSVQLFSDTVPVAGSTIAIRIIDGTISSGAVTLIVGDMDNAFSLSVKNNTSLPVQGTIACAPTIPDADEPFTLTFTPTNLAQAGLALQELTYQWYCEGAVINDAKSSILTVSQPLGGIHRYDLIVSSGKLGSVGSVSVSVNIPTSSAFN
ncbi:MAG: hypothetical protein WCR76_05530 [Sphaerochaetaceae bacterium]